MVLNASRPDRMTYNGDASFKTFLYRLNPGTSLSYVQNTTDRPCVFLRLPTGHVFFFTLHYFALGTDSVVTWRCHPTAHWFIMLMNPDKCDFSPPTCLNNAISVSLFAVNQASNPFRQRTCFVCTLSFWGCLDRGTSAAPCVWAAIYIGLRQCVCDHHLTAVSLWLHGLVYQEVKGDTVPVLPVPLPPATLTSAMTL